MNKNKLFAEEICAEVRRDFTARAEARRQFELQWQLNANFVMGNQYCQISPSGQVEDSERDYYWQQREVFNHTASIVETRCAKLMRVRPKLRVAPASGDSEDIKTARAAGKIIESVAHTAGLDKLLTAGTGWSEIAGSVFYKVSWDNLKGRKIGKDRFEGDVRVDVCPPYEIYPDSLVCQNIDDCNSIIHAKALHINEIERIWGKRVKPEPSEVLSLGLCYNGGGLGVGGNAPKIARNMRNDYAVVIERYTRPNDALPEGELVITAGNELLFYGALPYKNGADGALSLPFIKQDCIATAGSFFGASMVERVIPIQRAYNAVKNRKHEFLTRMAMGVLAVEDGSVDMENLEQEGLSPGKILVYRQGAQPPKMMDPGSLPQEFFNEETRLLNEFIAVSGVSEIMRTSRIPSNATSGVALQLLIEQDDTRLSVSAEYIRQAARSIAQHILRLYKQYAGQARLSRCTGVNGEVELICWAGSDISSDDIVFETENELNSTPAMRRNTMLEMYKLGLLNGENGQMAPGTKAKFLESLGYGGMVEFEDEVSLHRNRAARENLEGKFQISRLDNHVTHIDEHTKYVLSGEQDGLEKAAEEHIRQHQQYMRLAALLEGEQKDE